jgi:hypothetical protein
MATVPAPETVALVRRLYADGVPVRTILAESGLKLGALYRCLMGRFPDGTNVRPMALPLRRTGTPVRSRKQSRAALVARIWRTAERQIAEIEQRLSENGLDVAERESNARTLAVVTRMLRELSALDDAGRRRDKRAANGRHDEMPPRTIDELRRSLARKLDAFVAGRANSVPRDAD